MFKLDRSPAYWWPVEVLSAKAGAENAGRVDKQTFEVEFTRFDEKELDQLARDIAAEALDGGGGGGNIAWCQRVMRSFRGVEDNGASLAPTPENTERLLHVAGVAQAIVEAFFKSRHPAAQKK